MRGVNTDEDERHLNVTRPVQLEPIGEKVIELPCPTFEISVGKGND